MPALSALCSAGHSILSVVTQPDRKKGRGLLLAKTAIKELAEKEGIPVFQPEKINTAHAADFLKKFAPEVFVVIAYGQLLSREILAIPTVFPINIHASLLPKYRGAAPINWALINGEGATGITVIQMTVPMDAGPVLLNKEIEIGPHDTAATLENILADEAASILLRALVKIEKNDITPRAQNEKEATYAPKLTKQSGLIQWGSSAQQILNLIRGCNNWPGAFTYLHGTCFKIHKASLYQEPAAGQVLGSSYPGEIVRVSKDGILVACLNSMVRIDELQIEGKKRMGILEFLAGHTIKEGEILKTTK